MKISITGFSSAQNTGVNTKNVINFSGLLRDILSDSGHEVDYNLEDPDLTIVFVLDLASTNVKYYERGLKALATQKNVIVAFDDWSIRNYYRTLNNFLSGKRVFKSHFFIKQDTLMEYKQVLQNLVDGKYLTIFPAYKTGNHELLGINAQKKYAIDPSVYIEKEMSKSVAPGKLMAVHASLSPKWNELNKKKYSIINLRGESEDTVFEYYQRHRIVLSPPHYHDGSGWFRNRYTLANVAEAVVVDDRDSVFGPSYSIDRKEVTEKNIDELFKVQNESYKNTIMPKEEVQRVIKEILKEMGM